MGLLPSEELVDMVVVTEEFNPFVEISKSISTSTIFCVFVVSPEGLFFTRFTLSASSDVLSFRHSTGGSTPSSIAALRAASAIDNRLIMKSYLLSG